MLLPCLRPADSRLLHRSPTPHLEATVQAMVRTALPTAGPDSTSDVGAPGQSSRATPTIKTSTPTRTPTVTQTPAPDQTRTHTVTQPPVLLTHPLPLLVLRPHPSATSSSYDHARYGTHGAIVSYGSVQTCFPINPIHQNLRRYRKRHID